jgi:hypothetical protein
MKRVLVAIGISLAVIALFWAALHVFIPQVNPAQETPKGHFGEPCWACHIVRSGARLIDE